ncbi:acyl-CoA dehydrogenase [Manganibacter manganicus]|uniref:3-methylmercaptopropionyl-CoA dehydrogenase n=1 Tax=Manganibacter manganicus TaxID=1873176 RepID=A0A1V8RNJ6_9HYPH|nr:acyl-CoA dehydrogenase [Pseudaminobacter manganicus]OQM74767.1 acyl-CoA dehydrogenase [Pseudaminobacter manganicus]
MYRAPVETIAFTLNKVAGLDAALEAGTFGDLDRDVVEAILAEAGRFAGEELAPLAKVGDGEGAKLEGAVVTMPAGWRDLYRRWAHSGWNALTGPIHYGGQGLPTMLSVAVLEMWNSASMAFGVGPTLTMGAIEALDKHATAALKHTYLAKLVSGEWMATMNLTEPQAGSDLNALRTRAERGPDGTYRIFGQKIFITYGEHDLTDNIVHMVLARLPDAPAGTRGISLFLVPKFLLNKDGSPGRRNDVFCAGIERKLGIHASPTCTMVYGDGFEGAEPGAVGWLVGEENKGLACMFTMMNNARLAVGIQGVAVAEAAFQKALAYANERRQGRASSYAGDGMAPIVHHPDVQRNLLTMKALTQAARSICYACAHAIDMAHHTKRDKARYWRERADLLTPLAKAFSTDVGVEVTSLGVQVHGGMGFIEETGAAALYRDARIAPIYEGTNGIQAIDLVLRKLDLSEGEHVHYYIGELAAIIAEVQESNHPGFGHTGDLMDDALDVLTEVTGHLQRLLLDGKTDEVLAGATPYLRLFSLAAGGAYLAKSALAGNDADRIALCRFYAENLLSEVVALRGRAIDGAASLLDAGKALASD